MKRSSILCLLWLLCLVVSNLRAQDDVPMAAPPDQPLSMPSPTREIHRGVQRLPLNNPLPAHFLHSASNVIDDPSHSLLPFFKKLNELNDPIRIVHIGDSHVRGYVFPFTVRRGLEDTFGAEGTYPDSLTYRSDGLARETGSPGVIYHIIGMNGATSATFSTDERVARVASLCPDLIIVSFGTNEAHSARYLSQTHEMQLNQLIVLLKEACPHASFLLTTPPGAYVGRRRSRTVNPRTVKAARTMKEYASERKLAVWDLYNIVGGKADACRNWTKHRMIRPDGIHFTVDGYRLQGNLLHQAFIKAYNEYVATGME